MDADKPATQARVWTFLDWEFDELSRELRQGGRAIEMEAKPLDLLSELLSRAGEVVTKAELMEAVWPETAVVEGSLTTAVSKLRRVFGDAEIILTVPRVGYRLAVPVQVRLTAASTRADFGFEPGKPVPRREQWRFVRALDRSSEREVWLAENPKTRENRVFKFVSDGIHLRGLKREVTVSRFLREAVTGEPSPFVPVLEWDFEAAPWFLESAWAGENLIEWAENRGGLGNIPIETRLRVVIDVAEAMAAAHSVGVLHKDLKPANLLISETKVRIADFGSSTLTEPARLEELGITRLGFTREAEASSGRFTGTLMYLAPEVLAGQVSTVSADVYALGIILYQLLAGDFRKPLAPGWEAGIADPLLRKDVADAACGDPARRLGNAAMLAERLRSLEQRREEHDAVALLEQRAQQAERKLADARARRPWMMAAAVMLVAGVAISLVLYARAARERNRAQTQTAIASAMNRFLADDLLGQTDPFQSNGADETFRTVVGRASPRIDLQFRNEPVVAARLHQTIARALDGRTAYAEARREYETAAKLFLRAGGADSEDAVVVWLQQAAMEARTYEKGSLPLARTSLKRAEDIVPRLRQPVRPDLPVWLASARGMIALIDNNSKDAIAGFQQAVDQADRLASFDETARLTLKQRLAFAYMRAGDGVRSERLARELIAAFSKSVGPGSPHVLRVRLTLAQSLMIQNKHAEVIQEVDAIYPEFVARLGVNHELSMQALTTRAQSEGSLGMWDRAIKDDLAIHEIALQKQGPLAFFPVATLSDAALAQCRGGQLDAGLANARKSYEDAVKGFGPRAGLTGGTAYALASCLIDVHRVDEAARLLAGIDILAVAQLAGISDWGSNVTLAQAQIAYARKDYKSARDFVRQSEPAFLRADAEPYQKRVWQALKSNLAANER
jgi:DNA-binding winged helix-turn-helix (wHTH) protein/serine/threonine protein kinase